ncbi:MAG: site-specific integrase [Clostridium sp.]|nr:site-specific integrase [Clostridium sp.]
MLMEEVKNEFVLDCPVRNLAPRTIQNYKKQLSYFLRYLEETQGVKDLEELKPVHVKQFIAMLQGKKNKPSYVNDLLKAVKVLCRYAYEEGYIEELPTKRVKNVKEPKVLIHCCAANYLQLLKSDYPQLNKEKSVGLFKI